MAEKTENVSEKTENISGKTAKIEKKEKKMKLKIDNISMKEILNESVEGSKIPIKFSLEIKQGGKIMGTCHVSIDNLFDRVEFGDNRKNEFLFKPYDGKKKISKAPKPKEVGSKQCEDCGKMFKTNYRRRIHHDAIHKGLKPFKCTECGKLFARKEELAKHLHVHSEIKPYTCQVCGKGFVHKCRMETHVDIAHKGLQPFQCQQCEKRYSHKFDLKRHIDVAHRGLKPFKCTKCEQSFANKYEFKRHKKTHDDIEAIVNAPREPPAVTYKEHILNPRETPMFPRESLTFPRDASIFPRDALTNRPDPPSSIIEMVVCDNDIAKQNLMVLAGFSGNTQPIPTTMNQHQQP